MASTCTETMTHLRVDVQLLHLFRSEMDGDHRGSDTNCLPAVPGPPGSSWSYKF